VLRLLLSILFTILLSAPFTAGAIPQLPVGAFKKDSVKIGEPVIYTLYFKHDPSLEVIFPDSTYSFTPFELVRKNFFPTRTRQNQSTDSVVYILRTFEVTPVQRLQLPVWVLKNKDTTQLLPAPDSILLHAMVPAQLPDSLILKSNTQPLVVRERFNYPFAFMGLGVGFVLLLGIWGIFGRRIIINYKLYKLKNDHSFFVSKYNSHIERFNRSQSLQNIEKAITLWKNYLTRLEGSAINSFTTKEIAQFYGEDEDVATALKLFDKAIYGNMLSDESSETVVAFYLLHHFADRRYEFIKDQTRHVPAAR
jgi:hypothetical protein